MTEPQMSDEEKELYDAFTELGSQPELRDVEFAFFAQAEVALREEYGSPFE